jgi:hypothetical protein
MGKEMHVKEIGLVNRMALLLVFFVVLMVTASMTLWMIAPEHQPV